MSKKLIGLTLALSLFAVALPASAASLTQSQISAILGLLQSFGAEQSVVNNVAAALGSDYGIPSPLTCASFSDVSYGNFDNSPGGRVSQLQTWLGIPSSAFGFGTYGRKTQAAWDAKCGGNTNPKPATLSVTPRAGNFPLTVTVQPVFYELGDNYIKFGDGTQVLVTCAQFKPNTDACIRIAPVTHTYTSPGTYIAKQVPTDTPRGQEEYVYASATVTATANTVSFSATPTTGVAPLKVQFTSAYYSTHDASETQYYVRFGDESKDLGRITCIKSNGSDLGSSRCLQWGVSHVYASGTYTAELIQKVGSKSTTLSMLPIVVSGSNAGDIQVKNFQATQSGLTAEFSAEVVSGDWEKLIINFGDGTSGNMKKTVCPGITCFVGASHTYSRAGVYVAQLASKLKPSQVLGTATVTATTDTVSFSATPTTGVAPLTVSFKVPYRSAGGDYFSFGDGTTGCAVPGTTNDYMTGCGVPINTTFTHTYTQPGTYKVIHSRLGPSTVLGTTIITVGQN